MPEIILLSKRLGPDSCHKRLCGIALRHYLGLDDVGHWLAIKHAAFERILSHPRPWTKEDFRREFLARDGWRPERMWFAECDGQTVGTATLGMRGRPPQALPALQWLAVLPAWRRRGVATALVEALERAAWEEGHETVVLETRSDWAAAMALYRRLGYQPIPREEASQQAGRRRGAVAVITRDERLLVIRRSQRVVAPGKFCFPGGGVEPGESEKAALRRELWEELSLEAEPKRVLWRSLTPWNVSLSWWRTSIPEGSHPKPNPEEVESVHWLTPAELLALGADLLESNREFLHSVPGGR